MSRGVHDPRGICDLFPSLPTRTDRPGPTKRFSGTVKFGGSRCTPQGKERRRGHYTQREQLRCERSAVGPPPLKAGEGSGSAPARSLPVHRAGRASRSPAVFASLVARDSATRAPQDGPRVERLRSEASCRAGPVGVVAPAGRDAVAWGGASSGAGPRVAVRRARAGRRPRGRAPHRKPPLLGG